MTERQPTCEERIAAELKGRAEMVNELFERVDTARTDGDSDDAYEELDTLALSFESLRTYRIVLSTGGPHDELVATYAPGAGLVRLEYVFQDWFDGACRTIEADSAEWGALARYVEYLVDAWGD